MGYTDAATPTCATSGALSGCHDEGGAWSRLWSTTASLSTGAECVNCHGGVGTGYTGAAWVAGIGRRHADAQISPNHDTCNYCHEYEDARRARTTWGRCTVTARSS